MSSSNNDFELLHTQKVAALTFQHTLTTGKIGSCGSVMVSQL